MLGVVHRLVGARLGEGDVDLAFDDAAEVVDGARGIDQLDLETLGAEPLLVLVTEAVVDAAGLARREHDLARRRATHEEGAHDDQRRW